MHIGLLIPHFPSQTGAFFWREIVALESLGVRVGIASTRRPPGNEVCHTWAREAMQRTAYLFPPTLGLALRGVGAILRAGPGAWAKCVGVMVRADGLSLAQRVGLLPMLLMGGELAAIARREGWEHIHAHSAADAAFVVMFAAMLAKRSYSITLHGRLSTYGGGQREKWRHAAFGIAVNEQLKREILAASPGVKAEAIGVSAMGVDVERLKRHAAYAAHDGRRRVRLTSVGRLHLGKGHQDTIRAVALLRERGVEVELAIMGEGSARAQLEGLVAELKLEDRVKFLGAVSEDRIREEHERAHAFVLASHEEAVGVAAMEAMSMELPMIACAVGGLQELVRDGVDGVLVPKESPERIADAVREIVKDGTRARAMGAAGRKRIEEAYTSLRDAEVLKERIEAGRGSR